jgi:hypothetical protein
LKANLNHDNTINNNNDRSIVVDKYRPSDLVADVHARAYKLMPPQIELDVNDIRAVRIYTTTTAAATASASTD